MAGLDQRISCSKPEKKNIIVNSRAARNPHFRVKISHKQWQLSFIITTSEICKVRQLPCIVIRFIQSKVDPENGDIPAMVIPTLIKGLPRPA